MTIPTPLVNKPAMLDVAAVAALLDCSARHVYRLAERGAMPLPAKVGALVRWPRQTIEEWIAGGCKPIRSIGKG
jgi:excisionase family DNA binding protein